MSQVAVLLLAVLTASSTVGLKIQLANSSTSGITIVPLGDGASHGHPEAQAPSSASAAPALVQQASVDSQGDVAPVTLTTIPGDGDIETGHEHLQAHTDVETMRSILASLPEPEPDVVDALNRPGISDAELRIILRRVWDKRQAMLKQYMDSIKTDADFMKTLIERLMVPAVSGEGSEEDPRVSVLEDLEYHVGKADNAKDFKTVQPLLHCDGHMRRVRVILVGKGGG